MLKKENVSASVGENKVDTTGNKEKSPTSSEKRKPEAMVTGGAPKRVGARRVWRRPGPRSAPGFWAEAAAQDAPSRPPLSANPLPALLADI